MSPLCHCGVIPDWIPNSAVFPQGTNYLSTQVAWWEKNVSQNPGVAYEINCDQTNYLQGSQALMLFITLKEKL